MIYLSGPTHKIILLEPGNLEAIKTGDLETTQDDSVLIGYTPDVVYTQQLLVELFSKDNKAAIEDIEKIVKESITRPEVKERPYHKPFIVDRKIGEA